MDAVVDFTGMATAALAHPFSNIIGRNMIGRNIMAVDTGGPIWIPILNSEFSASGFHVRQAGRSSTDAANHTGATNLTFGSGVGPAEPAQGGAAAGYCKPAGPGGRSEKSQKLGPPARRRRTFAKKFLFFKIGNRGMTS